MKILRKYDEVPKILSTSILNVDYQKIEVIESCFFYMLPSGAACSSRSWLPGQLEGDWQRVDTVTDVAGMWTAARYCKLTMYSRYRWYAFTLQLQVTDAVKAGNTDAVVYSQWFTTCIR